MGSWIKTMDGGEGFKLDFFISEAITAGQVLVRTPTAAVAGEVADPASVNALTLAVGCADVDVTYNAAPTQEPNVAGFNVENLVRIVANPLSVWRFNMAGGTAAGTVLQPSTATPANILSQDAASTTVITDGAVGTASMVGGLIKGRSGANGGAIRRLSAHTNGTSTAVIVAFQNSVAVGDTMIRVPWSRAVVEMELTTNFVEANAIEATAAQGGPVAVVGVHIDEENDTGYVDVVFADNWLSPVAVGADLS